MKTQGEVHTGKTITDLSELVERSEAKAGCYAASDRDRGSEPVFEGAIAGDATADDPVVEYPIAEHAIGESPIGEDPIADDAIVKDPIVKYPIAEYPIAEEFQDSRTKYQIPSTKYLSTSSEDPSVEEFKDSCGAGAAAGKASDGACVEGLGERHGSPWQQGKDGDGSAMSSRSESQQNCAGLGAEWGIPPAGIQLGPRTAPLVFSTATRGLGSEFGAAADGAPFVAPSLAPYPGPSAAPKLLERGMGIGKGMEALILAQSCVLLSRALAYVGLADLDCARALAVEIRDHLDAINCYALAKGIGLELAEAQLNLMSVTGDFAVNDTTADIAVSDRSA
jgi:hypothetical protein